MQSRVVPGAFFRFGRLAGSPALNGLMIAMAFSAIMPGGAAWTVTSPTGFHVGDQHVGSLTAVNGRMAGVAIQLTMTFDGMAESG